MKQFRRVPTRYGKLAANYVAMLKACSDQALVAGLRVHARE